MSYAQFIATCFKSIKFDKNKIINNSEFQQMKNKYRTPEGLLQHFLQHVTFTEFIYAILSPPHGEYTIVSRIITLIQECNNLKIAWFVKFDYDSGTLISIFGDIDWTIGPSDQNYCLQNADLNIPDIDIHLSDPNFAELFRKFYENYDNSRL